MLPTLQWAMPPGLWLHMACTIMRQRALPKAWLAFSGQTGPLPLDWGHEMQKPASRSRTAGGELHQGRGVPLWTSMFSMDDRDPLCLGVVETIPFDLRGNAKSAGMLRMLAFFCPRGGGNGSAGCLAGMRETVVRRGAVD